MSEHCGWRQIRSAREAALVQRSEAFELDPRVRVTRHSAVAHDGHEIPLFMFQLAGQPTTGALGVFIHGGGFVLGSTRLYRHEIARYVIESGLRLVSVDYRRAGEVRHPVPLEDCYAALRWLLDHQRQLHIDAARIAVIGESAGGGLAAGVAIAARDAGIPLALQMLVYPMLDDRTSTARVSNPALVTWGADENSACWSALLGEAKGGQEVSSLAAPARLQDFARLTPAYVEVGDHDLFCGEAVGYAARLLAAGVSTELHVHPFAGHGYDRDPLSSVAARAWAERGRVLSKLVFSEPGGN